MEKIDCAEKDKALVLMQFKNIYWGDWSTCEHEEDVNVALLH